MGLKQQLIRELLSFRLGGGSGMVIIIGIEVEPVATEASVTLQQPEAHHVFSWGTCPWITGLWQRWAAQAPRGCVDSDLCLHTGGRGFLVCGNFSSFTVPSQKCRSCPYSFVSVFSLFFCSTQARGEFLAFWEVWGLLPAFSRCSVGVVPRADVFLMYLWGGRWSPHFTPPPSWRSPDSRFLLFLRW